MEQFRVLMVIERIVDAPTAMAAIEVAKEPLANALERSRSQVIGVQSAPVNKAWAFEVL